MPSERIQRQIDRLLHFVSKTISNQDWIFVGDLARFVAHLDPGNQDALAYLAAAERNTPPQVTQPAPHETTSQPPSSGTSVPESKADSTGARLEQYIPKELLAKPDGRAQFQANAALLPCCFVTLSVPLPLPRA